MKTQHTKGEWYYSPLTKDIRSNISDSFGHHTPIVAKIDYDCEHEEKEANAKLITAAPELLEALNNAIYLIETKLDGFGVDELKEAIKKATE